MSVKVINVPERIPRSEMKGKTIFLAGPTPRDRDIPSWRPDFIKTLEEKGEECTVFVPETSDGWWHSNYEAQCEWEYDHLHMADCIVFWIPRDLETLPGFTTNVEFGYWISQDECKMYYGRPDGSPKTRYLDWLYNTEIGEVPHKSMEELVCAIMGVK